MRGTVTRRGNKWQAMWYTHHKIDGKQERKSKSGFATKKEAERFLRQKIDEVESTVYTSCTRATVGAYLLHWLDEYSRNIKQNTINGYRVNIEKHINPVIGSVYLDKLTADDIDKVFKRMHEKGFKGTTQKYVYSVLRRALNQAVKRGTLPYNVIDRVEAPKKNKYQPTILTEEMMQGFEERLAETDIFLPINLCLMLGLRRGEMLGLRWSDVYFEAGIIRIERTATPVKGGYMISDTKSDNSNRLLQLPDILIDELKALYNKRKEAELFSEDDYINIDKKGKIMSASMLNKKFKKFLAECNIPDMRIHDMRHSYATLMLGKSVSMKVTSQILGHSSVSITSDLYSHMLIGMQKQAVNVINDIFK